MKTSSHLWTELRVVESPCGCSGPAVDCLRPGWGGGSPWMMMLEIVVFFSSFFCLFVWKMRGGVVRWYWKMLEKNPKLFFFSILLFCKKSLSVLHLKTWKKWKWLNARFVSLSNLIVWLDLIKGTVGLAQLVGIQIFSRKKDKLQRDHSYIEGSLRYWDQILRLSLRDPWNYLSLATRLTDWGASL